MRAIARCWWDRRPPFLLAIWFLRIWELGGVCVCGTLRPLACHCFLLLLFFLPLGMWPSLFLIGTVWKSSQTLSWSGQLMTEIYMIRVRLLVCLFARVCVPVGRFARVLSGRQVLNNLPR